MNFNVNTDNGYVIMKSTEANINIEANLNGDFIVYQDELMPTICKDMSQAVNIAKEWLDEINKRQSDKNEVDNIVHIQKQFQNLFTEKDRDVFQQAANQAKANIVNEELQPYNDNQTGRDDSDYDTDDNIRCSVCNEIIPDEIVIYIKPKYMLGSQLPICHKCYHECNS